MKKFVFESIEDILKPKGTLEVLNLIKDLPVAEKVKKIKEMKRSHSNMYNDLINNEEIRKNIVDKVKEELNKLDILKKINYIEDLEKDLPDIFKNMRDDNLLNDLKDFILNQSFEEKNELIWRFFKSWPDLFKHIEDDESIDEETNQILILFKIKGAINNHNVDNIQKFIKEIGDKYGRVNILELASNIRIQQSGYGKTQLFNKMDLQQLKLSLYKETRDEDEQIRDEFFDVYAFIGYPEYKTINVEGEEYHKKRLGIENLVKIDKYSTSSLQQISMMKIRATAQYNREEGTGTFAVYIPKTMWNKDFAYNNDIPDNLRKFIDENKFNV